MMDPEAHLWMGGLPPKRLVWLMFLFLLYGWLLALLEALVDRWIERCYQRRDL